MADLAQALDDAEHENLSRLLDGLTDEANRLRSFATILTHYADSVLEDSVSTDGVDKRAVENIAIMSDLLDERLAGFKHQLATFEATFHA